METRQLGKNGPALSVIGFGAWAIGGPWNYGWGVVDDDESVRAIRRALDTGVNWIDTAAAYGFGHSEEVVGRAVRGLGKRPFIATKCGLLPDGKGGVRNSIEPSSIRGECNASLKRLGVDCIDLYQIHWPEGSVPIEDAWGAMAGLQKEGKARYIGVSNFDVPLLRRCMAVAPVQSLQPPYSLITRDVEKETLAFCREQSIGVVAYSPMQSGLLTGKFDRGKMKSDDWRQRISLFREPELSRGLAFVESLRPIADARRKTVGQLAVAWVLSSPAVTSAIVGARTPVQAEENSRAAGWSLTSAELRAIEEAYRKHYGSPAAAGAE
ncbi:MAG TPA: aldo/keto reductase [Bacteroidota bacterium]|nr:aldo/keto reductase [Bacteroidota bacterium]